VDWLFYVWRCLPRRKQTGPNYEPLLPFSNKDLLAGSVEMNAERLQFCDSWATPAFSSSVSAFRYGAGFPIWGWFSRFRRTMTNEYFTSQNSCFPVIHGRFIKLLSLAVILRLGLKVKSDISCLYNISRPGLAQHEGFFSSLPFQVPINTWYSSKNNRPFVQM
jgi:hypothetical protein